MKKRGNATKESLKLDPDIFDAHQKRGIIDRTFSNGLMPKKIFTEMIRINPQSKFGYKLRSVASTIKKTTRMH